MIEPMLASAVDIPRRALLGFQRLGEQHAVDLSLQRRCDEARQTSRANRA